jgi:hypothetical protein
MGEVRPTWLQNVFILSYLCAKAMTESSPDQAQQLDPLITLKNAWEFSASGGLQALHRSNGTS